MPFLLSDGLKKIFQYALPKQLLTRLGGYLARIRNPRIKNFCIRYFIRKYGICMQEAREENPECYPDFNAFFIRQLKPNARPIAKADIISPVDGYISEIGSIQHGQLLQAKGRFYTVEELLACEPKQYTPFLNGRFATLYLSPKDYHRVHMPTEATLKNMIHVPGKLFSVQPATTRTIPNLFARNERVVIFFETKLGPMAMVLVGATIVGAIGTRWEGDLKRTQRMQSFDYTQRETITLKQAEEMGYFKLGSTVIVLFANSQDVHWQATWHAGDKIQLGEALGFRNSADGMIKSHPFVQ